MNDTTAPPSQASAAAPQASRPRSLGDLLRAFYRSGAPAQPGAPRRWHVPPRVVVAAFAPVLLGSILSMLGFFGGEPQTDVRLHYQPVERGNVTLTIVEKGELEAVTSTEVICKVRNKPGNWFATSMKWLIEDGTQVKKGDVVARLEDSSLREQYQTQTIAVTEKRALLIEAEREKEIVEAKAHSDIKTAENEELVAKINLTKFLEGDFEAKKKDVHGRITLSRAEMRQWEDRANWAARMLNRGFIGSLQLEAEQSRLQAARINHEKLTEEERVLKNYEAKATEVDLRSKLEKAEVGLKVARTEAEGKEAKAEANLRAKTTILDQEETKLKDLAEDIRNCTIRAPHDGMVVYYVREASKYGTGTQKHLVAVGEPAYENQKLMSIPDLRHMQVRVKIHESVQPRLRPDLTRKTPHGRGLEAVLLVAGHGPDRLTVPAIAPEVRRLATEEGLLKEEEIMRPGQDAQVKIAAVERSLIGRVRWSSTVASQLDSLSSDVRVYPTIIALDDSAEGLRPGMSAEVTVFVDERADVLRLPVHAVLDVGGEKFCYVRSGSRIEKRPLVTGLNSYRFIEVRDGLREGELAVQNPRPLAESRGDLQAAAQGKR